MITCKRISGGLPAGEYKVIGCVTINYAKEWKAECVVERKAPASPTLVPASAISRVVGPDPLPSEEERTRMAALMEQWLAAFKPRKPYARTCNNSAALPPAPLTAPVADASLNALVQTQLGRRR